MHQLWKNCLNGNKRASMAPVSATLGSAGPVAAHLGLSGPHLAWTRVLNGYCADLMLICARYLNSAYNHFGNPLTFRGFKYRSPIGGKPRRVY